jgi:quinol monooxygenase YgiN
MKTYIATYIEVQPNQVTPAVALLREYRERNTTIEPLQEVYRRNRFVVIEEWEDDSSFQAHDTAPQTAQFRSKLRDIHKSPYDQRVHHDFAIGPSRADTPPSSLFVVTHVDVPPPRREDAEALLRSVSQEIRNHEGNLRFDIFQQNAPRTNHFTTLSQWSSGDAFASHEANPQTRKFRELLGPMLGALYDERMYKRIQT